MKLSKTSLPDTFTYKSKVYVLNIELSHQLSEGKINKEPRGHILLSVMHSNLRGKLDFHGKPYKPDQWILSPSTLTQ